MESGTRVHLIGTGGCGMRGLAGYYLARGLEVSGSDQNPGPWSRPLEQAGARIYTKHRARNLHPEVARVVHSRAIPEGNPEREEARRRGIPQETFSSALGRELRQHRGTAIGVAGTHGKTTTSAWLVQMLRVAGRDPTFLIGGDGLDFGSGMAVGTGPEFIVEACEYGGSFLDLRPTLGVILNIEDDHLECYGGIEGVMNAFGKFARTLPPTGKLVVNEKFLGAMKPWGVTARVVPVRTDGPSDQGGAGYRLISASSRNGEKTYTLVKDDESIVELKPGIPGTFNTWNMLFASAVALEVGASPEACSEAAVAFQGVRRRFEDMGTHRGITVVDDYAHHPTEVQAALSTARQHYAGRRLTAVFEPHQFRRLNNYLGDFARELSGADQVFVCDVFAARERPEDWRNIGPDDLVEAIRFEGGEARFLPLKNLVHEIVPGLHRGDVVLTMGAGRVGEVADGLVRRLH